MRKFYQLAVLLAASFVSAYAFAGQKTWESVYIDINDNCATIALANEKAEIDFAKRECASFGGYRMFILGADLRYSPSLEYKGKPVFDLSEFRFHDMGANKVEWVYLRDSEADGNGQIAWKGFIFRLSVASDSGEKDDSILYVLRLDGAKTCLLGKVKTNEEAHKLVQNLNARCQ